MNPVLLDLGFVKIYWYSVCILLGLLVGGYLVLKESKKFHISEDSLLNLILALIIFGILGARLYYVIFNWSYYGQHLDEIIKIWEGGLAIHGAMIAGLICIIIYTKKQKINTFRLLDIIAVGLIIGQAFGRWGNFFNGEAHGVATSLEFLQSLHLPQFIIDGMHIYGTYYHPTFLYESLWCVIGFMIMLFVRRRSFWKVGQTTGLYFIWYGIGRFFIEGMRTDSLMLGNLRMAQLISIVMIIAGIVIMITQAIRSKAEYYNGEKDYEK